MLQPEFRFFSKIFYLLFIGVNCLCFCIKHNKRCSVDAFIIRGWRRPAAALPAPSSRGRGGTEGGGARSRSNREDGSAHISDPGKDAAPHLQRPRTRGLRVLRGVLLVSVGFSERWSAPPLSVGGRSRVELGLLVPLAATAEQRFSPKRWCELFIQKKTFGLRTDSANRTGTKVPVQRRHTTPG